MLRALRSSMRLRLEPGARAGLLYGLGGLVAAAAGCGPQAASGGASGSGGTECPIVVAASYDQSCSKGTDCTVAFEEFGCGSCSIGAINTSAEAQYEADSSHGTDFCFDAIYNPAFVCCVAGVCQAGNVCFPDGSATGAACAAAGGTCQASRCCAECTGPASAQDCSTGSGPQSVCCLPLDGSSGTSSGHGAGSGSSSDGATSLSSDAATSTQ
jgi:hypothetical protein